MDRSLPGSSVHGIFQARVLEWMPFPSPVDLPDPGIEPRSPTLEADTLTSEPPGKRYDNNTNTVSAHYDFPDLLDKWSVQSAI